MTSALEPTRPIAWDALDASGLAPEKRAIVGATWRERARQEHLAVGAFALLARELAEEGCDSIVLALVTKAAWDEVRHETICRKLGAALLGEREIPARWRGVPNPPSHADPRTRTLLHMVEMCCLSETLTGVHFSEMLARASNPVAHDAVAALLEDEIDHGRAGWAYVGARKRDGALDGLAGALPALLDRTVGRALVARDDRARAPRRRLAGLRDSRRRSRGGPRARRGTRLVAQCFFTARTSAVSHGLR